MDKVEQKDKMEQVDKIRQVDKTKLMDKTYGHNAEHPSTSSGPVNILGQV